jgi:drug/metabolite transporter (DMT)-like permease
MQDWVLWTLWAAFFQNARSSLQKRSKADLGTLGSAYCRFVYAWPFAVAYLFAVAEWSGAAVPAANGPFLLWAAFGGAVQIGATVCLIHAFGFRNFAIATAYSKTDTLQAAVFGIVLLGDPLSPAGAAGILLSMAGVIAISLTRNAASWKTALAAVGQPAALYGIAAGGGFALSAVCYRAAALSLAPLGATVQAATTLAWVLGFQTLAMGGWLAWRRRAQFLAVLEAWRSAVWIGIAGMAASAGWFTAMTLENAAYVRAVGQVELVFALLASWLAFKERSTWTEILGIAAVAGGIAVLLLGST